MEPEGSLPYSQAPATCPYTEPTHIYICVCVCVCVCVYCNTMRGAYNVK